VNKKSYRRFLVSLAPLLAIVALASIPASAQAKTECTAPLCPHWYQNGNELVAGQEFPIVSWGKLTLLNTTLGPLECENVAAGDIINPEGYTGGRGTAITEAFVPYDCTNGKCEVAGEVIQVAAEKLPWAGFIDEITSGSHTFRQENTGVEVHITCPKAFVNEKFFTDATHTQKPRLIKGAGIGVLPSELVFGEGSGELNSVPLIGTGTTEQSLKAMGFTEQQTIAACNTILSFKCPS
jgi:hypothetical protein